MKPLLLGRSISGKPIQLCAEERKINAHCIGASGSGKSKLLESMIRGDLKNRQGIAVLDPHGQLYNDVLDYCAHRCLERDIIPLNLSDPQAGVIGFNPFQRAEGADLSVQVDRRIGATLHAWNVPDADQTPTLARTLRLIYTAMLEHNLGLPQVAHLIDFDAKEIRSSLIDRLSTPLIQKEWLELQQLKARDWRDEILSAKNRLFKLLTSPTLSRVMGLPGRSLDIQRIMDEGKILLVNLAPSDYLSHENARTVGALLINEFYECALRRRKDDFGRPPKPFYVYADEFQNFVSLAIADSLDETRKFGLFFVLAHQRFGQLDPNITDAILTNCRIKFCFGGLPVESAQKMAHEMFIGKLDPKKIKVAIKQTKFWPEYRRDKVYTRSSSHGSSTGSSSSTASGNFSGSGDSTSYFTPDAWFAGRQETGSTTSGSSGYSSMSQNGYSNSESWSDSESEADIPMFFPVPFQELSTVQYYSVDEQLTELTAALKEQYQRHCFIKLPGEETQPMLVPFVESCTPPVENRRWYISRLMERSGALPVVEVDRLLEAQETALLQEHCSNPPVVSTDTPVEARETPIWNRTCPDLPWSAASATPVTPVKTQPRKRVRKATTNSRKGSQHPSAYQQNLPLEDSGEDQE
jgi:hypothetical protein